MRYRFRIPPASDWAAGGPRGRLGVLWLAALVAAIVAFHPWAPAVWLAATAALGAAQVARTWRAVEPGGGVANRAEADGPSAGARVRGAPIAPIVVVASAGIPLAAAAGPTGAAAAALALVAVAAGAAFRSARPMATVVWTTAVPLVLGLACGSVVLAAREGPTVALAVMALATAYDTGAYLVGTGASNAWEGPAAGMASVAAVTLLLAALLEPHLGGWRPGALWLTAAASAPVGPILGRWLLGPYPVRTGGLVRLDSLIVLGPATAVLLTSFGIR